MADYQVVLYDPFGVQLAILDSFVSLDYARVVNSVGALTLVLPGTFDKFLFSGTDVRVDNRIGVYRSIGGGQFKLDMDTIWLIQYGEKTLTERGEELTKIQAVDIMELLKRRIVAYASGTANADKTSTSAGNMMKAIVRENLGSLATDTSRSWASYLTVQADLADGATISKAFARRNVLTVLQEIATASEIVGTYIAFDIFASGPRAFQFRTFAGQRGIDHRFTSGQNPVLIGPEYGNLADVIRAHDHASEATYIYSGGKGEGSARAVGSASDTNRIALSPFGRIERFSDTRMTADSTTLNNEASAVLRQFEPRSTFSGRLIDTPATTYGLHYGLGDFVTAQFEGEIIDCRVQSIRVTVRGGRESINTQLRNDY